MNTEQLLQRAMNGDFLTAEEGIYLFEKVPTVELAFAANFIRKQKMPENKVTWIIDRNANTTNVCIANCKFCNFFIPPGKEQWNGKTAYITTIEEYAEKIEEMYRLGGRQLLLQGGHHPELGLSYYTTLFRELKSRFPDLKLHALGPPEVAHICKKEGISHEKALLELKDAGLDTLPGAGAEILDDRVRRMISKGKCSAGEWLDVMRAAHRLHITSSATMMFGHIETLRERFEHLVKIRTVQDEKPEDAKGFIAFIPWTFQDKDTMLRNVKGIRNNVSGDEYVKMIALSRIMLSNIINIQASWLTVGPKIAQICLHAGANDFGSIMIEENVVSAAGAPYRFTSEGIQQSIREAGFSPQLRNQEYEYIDLPEMMEQQVINY